MTSRIEDQQRSLERITESVNDLKESYIKIEAKITQDDRLNEHIIESVHEKLDSLAEQIKEFSDQIDDNKKKIESTYTNTYRLAASLTAIAGTIGGLAGYFLAK